MRFQSIASGSSGNCIYVGSSRTHLLMDVGINKKKTEQALHGIGLGLNDVDGIFLTHEHSDHIAGLPVIAKHTHIPVFATKGTINAVLGMSKCKDIDPARFIEVRPDEPLRVGDLEIDPMRISHDAAEPVGYRIYEGKTEADALKEDLSGHGIAGNIPAEIRISENKRRTERVKKACICTDLGCFTEYTEKCLEDSDVLLLEANHDVNMLQVGPYPYRLKQRILGERGHLSNCSSGQLLSRILNNHLKGIFLGHLSQENNIPELAFETVRVEIMFSESGYRPEELPIQVAKRTEPSALVEF